jgi:hypothetical protein
LSWRVIHIHFNTFRFYCPHKTTEPIICPAAYYCPEGSRYTTKCENGYYCPQGSADHIICPSGTMGTNNMNNFDQMAGCAACGPGFYSETSEGGELSCLPCTPGYVCLGGTSSSKPVDEVTEFGYECKFG